MKDEIKNEDNFEVVTEPKEEKEEVEVILKFKKPYIFEGKEYTEVDLSALEDITGADMIKINTTLEKRGHLPVLQEMSLEYAQEIAAQVTGKPIEFFQGLPARHSMKLKNLVTNFIFGEE